MDFTVLKEFMQNLSDTKVPGNSISIYSGTKQIFKFSTGYSDIENKVRMNGNEHLYIYSCSKIATVVAVMQLLERGKILVTDPIYEYIPEYKEMYVKIDRDRVEKAKKSITIRHLLTMTAGLSYDFNTDGFKQAKKVTNGRMNTLAVIKCIAQDPLSFEPGTHWQYSLCHDVLAGLVEVVSGKKFRDYVKENIFEPLDMNNSYYHLNDKIEKNMAKQYQYCPSNILDFDLVQAQKCNSVDGGVIKSIEKRNEHILGEEYDSGGAGIITTVDEYSKLIAALANFGRGVNGEQIITKGTVEMMRENALDYNQMCNFNWQHLSGYGYGYGVRTLMNKSQAGSIGSIGEFGWGGAAGATALIDTEYNLAVFYAHHMINPREDYYQPRLRNAVYKCIQ